MQNNQDQPIVRPQLLVILCFLTFINSVSGLWEQAERFWNPAMKTELTLEAFAIARQQIEGRIEPEQEEVTNQFLDSLEAGITIETIRNSAIVLFLFHSITLFGAYMMWGLQKRGYQVYLGGILLLVISPILFNIGGMGVISHYSSAFFSLIFAFLYRTQRKYWVY